MRKLIVPVVGAAITLGALGAPAHAEQVDIGVIVHNNFSAEAYGFSTKPGETFGDFSIYRVSATGSLADPHVREGASTGGASVPAIAGADFGTATYVVNAHPMNGDEPSPFFFTSVVVCVRTDPASTIICTQGVGEHTVISLLTGP